MNILFFNDVPFNPSYGGIERVTDTITKGLLLLGKGYNVYYLFYKVYDRSLLEYNFPAQILEMPYEHGFYNPKNLDYYFRIINEYDIDIVVNQRGGYNWANNAMLLTNTSKVISVVHSKVDFVICQSIMMHKVNNKGGIIRKIKWAIKNICPFLLEKYVKFKLLNDLQNHYNELLHISDAVVLLSKKDVESLKSYVDISSKALVCSIPNPNTFTLSDANYSIKKNVILYVGRLDSIEKAPIRMLQIWRKLYRRHEEWELVIVGNGDDHDNMVSYVKKYNLPRVSFEGCRKNVEDYYKSASIVCLTSNYEGWGMSLTEGMTYGCVPVTFNNYGAAYDIIDDGINGCIIKAYDLTEYALRLSELMSDKNKLIEMGKHAHEKVNNFSIENVVGQWHTLFNKLVNIQI